MSKPSRTIKKLHFEDLSPSRFEDLSLNLIYPLNKWRVLNHYGASGNDDGIDIYAEDELENGIRRTWFIQCKRYKKVSYSNLKKALDKALKKNEPKVPDIFLIIVSCSVTKKSQENFENYASLKGVKNPIIWSRSNLETKLYNNRKDLLFTYFEIDLLDKMKKREELIQRNIELKKRMIDDFKKEEFDQSIDYNIKPYKKFEYKDLIIHSIDDSYYPELEEEPGDISGWFKVEFYDFYFNGIEVILNVTYAIRNKEAYWALLPYKEEVDEDKFTKFKVIILGQIPYKNIVDYDLIGDKYYRYPHIYCNFAEQGEPYENYSFALYEKENFIIFPDHKVKIEDLKYA